MEKNPPAGYLKVNWGAGCHAEIRKLGFGAIIRDETGAMIGTMCPSRSYNNPLVAEAFGLLLAVQFYKDVGLKEFIIEGDSLQVVNLLQSMDTNWSQAGFLIQDAKTILQSFATWSVMHACRYANEVIHILAKNATSLVEDIFDLESIPSCITNTVSVD